MSSSEKWRSIISNHSKLKNDDKSLKDMNKVTQDITELITAESYVLTTVELSEVISCLRVILQFWSKLVQSPANAWSRVCINVSALLTRVLAQPDSGVSDEMMLKSSKLIGFTLARLSLMGEGDAVLPLLSGLTALIASISDSHLEALSDTNFDKMLLYFCQSIGDVCGKLSRLKVSSDLVHCLGECCKECLLRDTVRVKVLAAVTDNVNKNKLVLYICETVFAWTAAAQVHNIEIDFISSVLQQVFESLFTNPSSVVISKTIDLSTRLFSSMLKEKDNIHALLLCRVVNDKLISMLSEQWTNIENVFIENDNPLGGLQVAFKLWGWLQELKLPNTLKAVPKRDIKSLQRCVKSLFDQICSEEHIQSVPTVSRGGWNLLVDVIATEEALANDPNQSVIEGFHFIEFYKNNEGPCDDVERDLLALLLSLVIEHDMSKKLKSSDEIVLQFESIEIFQSLFMESTSLRPSGFSFKILLACLRLIFRKATEAGSDATIPLLALGLQFSALAIEYVTTYLTWDYILNGFGLDSCLKMLSNILLLAAPATSVTSVDSFQAACCHPLFLKVSKFFKVVIKLFCSATDERDDNKLQTFALSFSTLGEVMVMMLHSCSKLGMGVFYHTDILELMDDSVIIFDIINCDMITKQKISSRYAKYLIDFCSNGLANTDLSERRAAQSSYEWNIEIAELSSFCILQSKPIDVFLQTSCRYDAIENYIQGIKELSPQYIDGKLSESIVDDIIQGLNIILGQSTSPQIKQKLCSVLKLNICSIFLWSMDSSLTRSARATEHYDTAAVVKELKDNLLVKSKNSAGSKKSRKNGHSSNTDYLSELACKLKSAILLLQWTFKGDIPMASGTEGAVVNESSVSHIAKGNISGFHVVLSAFMLWREILNLSRDINSERIVLLDIYGDTYLLFFFLGLHGKVDEQVELLSTLYQSLFADIDNESEEAERYSLLLRNLKSYMEIWLVYHGQNSKLQMLESIGVDETPLSSAISEYIAQGFDILQVSKNIKTISTISVCDNQELYQKWTKDVEALFHLCRVEKLPILAAQVALLHSKLSLIATGQHEISLKWAKYAISVLHGDSSGVAVITVATCADITPIEVEGMLLIADLHETTGSLDRCISYLVEAKSLTMCTSSPIQKSLYSLHAFRIWFRLNSKKFWNEIESITHCLDEVNNLSQDNFVCALLGQNGKPELFDKNFVLERINDAMSYIINQMRGDDCPDFPSFNDQATKSALNFRFLDHQWNFDVSETRSSSSVLKHKSMRSAVAAFLNLQQDFHTTLSFNMRYYLTTAFDTSAFRKVGPSFSGLNKVRMGNLRKLFQSEVNGRSVSQSSSFDVLRSLRRRFSLACLTGQLVEGDIIGKSGGKIVSESTYDAESGMLSSMYAFVLGTASCGTSVETSLENKSDMSKDRSSQLSTACQMVQQMCIGNDDVVRRVMKLLEYVPMAVSAPESREDMITCFLTLEHRSKEVIIGRKDSAVPFPFVVALPCYEELLACLEDWESIIEMNTSQLGKVKNYEEVKKWNNSDKGAWWNDRDVLDARILDFMSNIQSVLGVWRCLLVPKSLNTSRFPVDTESKIRSLFDALVKTSRKRVVPKSSTKKDNASKDDGLPSVLFFWLHYVCLVEVLSSDEQIECICQLLGFALADIGIDVSNEDLLAAATGIWELTFSIKLEEKSGEKETDNEAQEVEYSDDLCAPSARIRFESMKVPELRVMLKDLKLESSGRKSELIDRLVDYHSTERKAAAQKDSVENTTKLSRPKDSSHVVLILDELLQTIPFENIPLLRHKEVSRVPGLTVLVNLLLLHTQQPLNVCATKRNNDSTSSSKMLSLANCWYSIDPDANLLNTRNTMKEFMQPYATKWGWTGFVGEMPPVSSIKNFHENSDLFVFCGHGSGDKLFDKQNRLRKLRCPAAMLWGCSSGALTSNGVHDPMGTSISYLLGGAPFVIGNLWDVTDKDIDKLSIQCMSSVFDNSDDGVSEGNQDCDKISVDTVISVSKSLSLSRGVCKLKAAVGFAPVMYGLPMVVDCR